MILDFRPWNILARVPEQRIDFVLIPLEVVIRLAGIEGEIARLL